LVAIATCPREGARASPTSASLMTLLHCLKYFRGEKGLAPSQRSRRKKSTRPQATGKSFQKAVPPNKQGGLRASLIYDLTLPLGPKTVVYPGDLPPVIEQVSSLDSGDRLTSSHLSVGCHVGTHVDAPAHFLREGSTIDGLPLQCFCGPAIVIDMRGKRCIRESDVRDCSIPENHHVLLKTDNSTLLAAPQFAASYTYVVPAAAAYLCELNPCSVGIDCYSFDPYGSEEFPSHKILAEHNLPAFVCLNLGLVPAGVYSFAGLPLLLERTEASPVRAIVWR
jgi:arylformamidase